MKGLLEQIQDSGGKPQTYELLTKEKLEKAIEEFFEKNPPPESPIIMLGGGARPKTTVPPGDWVPKWKRKMIAKSELKPYDMLDEDYYDMLKERSDNFTKEKKLTRQEKTWLEYYRTKIDLGE